MDTVSIDSRSLYEKLGSAGAPCIVDVRRDAAYASEPRMIPGALRASAGVAGEVVVYCVHGHEVSQKAAEGLRAAGHTARYLEGGIQGWIDAGFPTIRRRPEWRVPGGSRWITRERPKIDRVACPWLILRFIDPLAAFDYVPTQAVFAEAERRSAVPYDIPGAIVTHRGERCSFDALIEDFGLADPALDRLAAIVRGADTDRLDLAPQSAGLLATSLGLSQRYADDHEMLANAMPVYDGLYAWCRREMTGGNERHCWNPAP